MSPDWALLRLCGKVIPNLGLAIVEELPPPSKSELLWYLTSFVVNVKEYRLNSSLSTSKLSDLNELDTIWKEFWCVELLFPSYANNLKFWSESELSDFFA